MKRHSVSFDTDFHERLKDMEYARMFLEAAVEETDRDGDYEALLLAMREVVDAQGGVPKMAQQMGVQKQSLYKVLSRQGNPRLNSFGKLLRQVGLRMTFEILE